MRYEHRNGRIIVVENSGNEKILSNFDARISQETRYVDERAVQTVLTITGYQQDRDGNQKDLPAIKVPAEIYPSMSWVLPNWGVQAVIHPGDGVKEHLRTAIQLASQPEVRTIFRHTGWQDIHGTRTYLHGGGGIQADGNKPDINVDLPIELSNYNIKSTTKIAQAIDATLSLLFLSRLDITAPLLAATFAPLYGPIDFALHLTGRTGTFKSEIVSLFQCHYGHNMDARHLPGSWSSTANALEAQAYTAKNAVFVIDDFIPAGTSWQQRAYQTTADKLIRGAGNQAGRARLSDTINLQTAMYPRGMIVSTGEDTPEGHSVRARMLILELSPGDVKTERLTAAQKLRETYQGTTAALIQRLAAGPVTLDQRTEQYRDQLLDVGHSRTPSMLGRLLAVTEDVLRWMLAIEAIKEDQHNSIWSTMRAAILEAGDLQESYLQAADPVDLFTATIRHLFSAHLAHVRTLNGGIPRHKATILGWTQINQDGDDMPLFKSAGPCIGWVDINENELYIDANSGYAVIKKHAGGDLTLTKNTMIKRLRDAGLIRRVDDARQRNTIRITAESHPRQVMALSLSQTLDVGGTPE